MKKKGHKLTLHRETLQRLTPNRLTRIAGGALEEKDEPDVTLPSCIDGCPSTPRQCDTVVEG